MAQKKAIEQAAVLEVELVDESQGMDAPVVAEAVTLKAADLRATAPSVRVRACGPVGSVQTPDGLLVFACDATGEYVDVAADTAARLVADPRFVVEG